MNRPVAFNGSEDEKIANWRTHVFFDDRCAVCDCRPYGVVADYPCGVEPLRETVDTSAPGYSPGSFLEVLILNRPE